MAIDKIVLQATDSLFTNTEIDGTEAARMPVGTEAQRTNPKVGDVRHNTDIGYLEQYTADGWASIAASPVVSTISPTAIPDTDSSFDITINGSNFSTGATVQAIGQDGSIINATSTSRTSGSVLVATFDGTQFADAQEDYSIKVSNNTGLAFTYTDSLAVNASPAWVTAASPTTLATVYNDTAVSGSTIQVSATDPEGGSVTYSLDSGALPTGMTVNSDGTITGTPTGGTATSGGETFTPVIAASDGTNSVNRTFAILRKWIVGSESGAAATSIASLYDAGVADGMIWFQNANINGGTPFQMRYASYDGRGWLETLYSQDPTDSTPWDDWLNKGGVNYTRPQMYDYNLSSGGLNYSSGNSSFVKLHSSLNLVDIAVTSKSSRTANGIAATGQNQNSALPLVASNDLVGSGAASCRAALAAYFGGYGEGFHAVTDGSGDYTAGWSKAGLGNFEIILAYRGGSQSLDEWHIVDGSTLDGTTYHSNIGYRQGYSSQHVGSWTSNQSDKSSTYDMSASNVLSVWVTDEI
jgi:hypothetical protein